jgi:hypothetical protein
MALPRDVTGFDESEVKAVFAAAKAHLLAGKTTVAWSSAGNSVSKLVPSDMTPSEVIAWCQWALRELNPATYGYNVTRTRASF